MLTGALSIGSFTKCCKTLPFLLSTISPAARFWIPASNAGAWSPGLHLKLDNGLAKPRCIRIHDQVLLKADLGQTRGLFNKRSYDISSHKSNLFKSFYFGLFNQILSTDIPLDLS